MNEKNDDIDEPQSEVHVELSAAENQIQKGIIFSEGNSLKQHCEVVYEPHESVLDAGTYSFDMFYEPNINVDDATRRNKNTESKSAEIITLKLNKSKN